jgi:hypothetical protein
MASTSGSRPAAWPCAALGDLDDRTELHSVRESALHRQMEPRLHPRSLRLALGRDSQLNSGRRLGLRGGVPSRGLGPHVRHKPRVQPRGNAGRLTSGGRDRARTSAKSAHALREGGAAWQGSSSSNSRQDSARFYYNMRVSCNRAFRDASPPILGWAHPEPLDSAGRGIELIESLSGKPALGVISLQQGLRAGEEEVHLRALVEALKCAVLQP